MDRFTVHVPLPDEAGTPVPEWAPADVSAMLAWLESTAGTRDASIYHNGRQTARLLRLGQKRAGYWMIVPV